MPIIELAELEQKRISLTPKEVTELVNSLFDQMRLFSSVIQPGSTGYLLGVEAVLDVFPNLTISEKKNKGGGVKENTRAFLLTKIRAQYHYLRDIQASLGNKEALDLKNKYGKNSKGTPSKRSKPNENEQDENENE